MDIANNFIQTNSCFLGIQTIIVRLNQFYANNIAFTLKILVISTFRAIFLLFVFSYLIMESFNIDNPSKTLVFKKFKHLPNKYYPKFVKTFKIHPNKFDTVSCSFNILQVKIQLLLQVKIHR